MSIATVILGTFPVAAGVLGTLLCFVIAMAPAAGSAGVVVFALCVWA
jgi:hypothetical protein